MRRHASLSAAVAALLVIAGCRLGESTQVEEVDPELLSGLAEPTTSTTITVPETAVESTIGHVPDSGPTSVAPTGATTLPATTTTIELVDVTVFFIDGSMLVEMAMPAEADARLRHKLRLLEEGPTEDQREAGARTSVLAGLVSGVQIRAPHVTVDLDGDVLANVERADQRLMIGQIVLTITADPAYTSVSFTLDGEPIGVFLRDGTRGEPGEPVTAADYRVLLGDPD